MTTLTLSLTKSEKRFIKMKATMADTTMKDFILRSVGWEGTKEINEVTAEAIAEMKKGIFEKGISSDDFRSMVQEW